MKGQNYWLYYFLLLIGQIILCNYFPFGMYVVLSLLPAMVLCIPLTISTAGCMFIAFASGLAVDWLSEGLLGINAAGLVPVGLLRKPFIRFFLGEDLITRKDSFTFRKNGAGKISMALIMSLAVFLSIYIFLDGAGTRPALIDLARFGASLLCCWPLALLVTDILTPDDRK